MFGGLAKAIFPFPMRIIFGVPASTERWCGGSSLFYRDLEQTTTGVGREYDDFDDFATVGIR